MSASTVATTQPEAVIYHLVGKEEWDKVQAEGGGYYTPTSIASDGFVHTSRLDQVLAGASYLFKGRKDMILLRIDRSQLKHEIKDEPFGTQGDTYGHIFGPLNLDAVTGTAPLVANAEGGFDAIPDF